MMGDDGEKFGAWPTTWEHCWGEGRWVDRFFEALEANADWLTTITPSDWLAAHPPIGRVYIPTGSYAEMGEWALPPDESRVFAAPLHGAEAGAPEARWLRGGFWRNFQVKYREINDLHKQMLRVSTKVEAMAAGPGARPAPWTTCTRASRTTATGTGCSAASTSATCASRRYEHLIAAEDLADRAGAAAGSTRPSRLGRGLDLDVDGRDEVLLSRPGQVVAIELDGGRRHRRLGRPARRGTRWRRCCGGGRRPTTRRSRARGTGGDDADGGRIARRPASIHDIVRRKEADLADRLDYDDARATVGPGPIPRPRRDRPTSGRPSRDRELGDAVDGAVSSCVESEPAGSSCGREAVDRGGGAVRRHQVDHPRGRSARPTLTSADVENSATVP